VADIDYAKRLREIAESNSDLYAEEREAVMGAADLIERLTKPIDYDSEEGFAVRTLRTAAERGAYVLVESERGSYVAKPHSDAILAILKDVTLFVKEAGVE
jgi:hypothetical protein